jgi:hypothetical protein
LLAWVSGRPLESAGNSPPRKMVATEVRFGTEPGVSAGPFPQPLQAAKYGDYLAEHCRMVAQNGLIGTVLRQ